VSWIGTPNEPPKELIDDLKEELRIRYARGERPSAREYLDRFPRVREDRDLALSLIYEEFCLLEEVGECPDPEGFCRRYPLWEDSLEVQLRVHRELSRFANGRLPTPPPLEPGDCFHGFRIESILGTGGTSCVYLAREEAMGDRAVVVKVSPDRGPEPGIIGCLDHPRIMPGFSICRDPARGLRGLCMPYRRGAPLDELGRRSRDLKDSHGASAFWMTLTAGKDAGSGQAMSHDRPGWLGFPWGGSYENGVIWIVMAVAQAVSHIHSRGIIHCDIKPSNVYVGAREGPLLFDFGFARSRRVEEPLPGGTPAYMAPEQLRSFLDPRRWSEVGPASDIYALGLTLLELLIGTPPETPPATLTASDAIRELLDRRSEAGWATRLTSGRVAPALEAVTRRCLAPSPGERYADARELLRDLGRLLARSPTTRRVAFTIMMARPARSSATMPVLGDRAKRRPTSRRKALGRPDWPA
jgi:serine/threonine protein kinase